MIGESADVPGASPLPAEVAPSVTGNGDPSNPTVDQLVQLWQGGSHEAVALRILDALDSYADFLEVAHRIGHEGSSELGRIMDAYTSEEKSPHQYDRTADDALPSQSGEGAGTRPAPGTARGAMGE